MRRLLREPLIHFLVLGAALFAVYSLVSARDAAPRDAIIVSAGKIEQLAALFARTWQRPPTREELDGLIDDFIREEVAYREGQTAGLDRDDTIIRRRIRQKLEFIAEDLAGLIEPSDEDLVAYLAAHPEGYRVDPRLTFRQVYLNTDERGEAAESDARDLLIALNGDSSVDATTLGDRILLEHGYADMALRDVGSTFGPQFANSLVDLEPGAWQGPIESAYGVHLVYIDQRDEGRLPELDEVRIPVRRDWDNARRVEAIDTFYRELIQKYEVIIEPPAPQGPEGAS